LGTLEREAKVKLPQEKNGGGPLRSGRVEMTRPSTDLQAVGDFGLREKGRSMSVAVADGRGGRKTFLKECWARAIARCPGRIEFLSKVEDWNHKTLDRWGGKVFWGRNDGFPKLKGQ